MIAYRVEGMNPGEVQPDPSFAQRLAESRDPGPAAMAALMLRPGVAAVDQAEVRTIVREITGGAELPAMEFTKRVNRWLAQRHGYSLTPAIPAGTADALLRWMKSREPGHCELFAGSFTLLARVAGFPARVVTGFKGGTWNAYSNNFSLRNSDAHAWCEIFDRASGSWLRADPTVGAAGAQADEVRGEAAIARRMDRSWSARLESLRVFWYRRIVNFDQRSQIETLKAVKEATQNSGRQLREMLTAWMAQAKAWILSPWGIERALKVVLSLAAVIALMWGLQRFARGWMTAMRARGPGDRHDPIRAEAGRWLRRISETASPVAEGQAITRDLERIRFGRKVTWPEPRRVFGMAKRIASRAARR
jgi:transglutaminase-like putative cysteine protease